jgi:hypothetical protein
MLTFALFKNKNVFTLLLGLTLLIGNFCGLSAFHSVTTSTFSFRMGSLKIPLYWGQQFYSMLLVLYLIFNKEFFTGILTKEYWTDFTTRTSDLEPVVEIIKAETHTTKTDKPDRETQEK